jgi:hypothetical protein
LKPGKAPSFFFQSKDIARHVISMPISIAYSAFEAAWIAVPQPQNGSRTISLDWKRLGLFFQVKESGF